MKQLTIAAASAGGPIRAARRAALQATGNLSIRETARPRASKETRRLHRLRCWPGSRRQSGADEDFPISDGADQLLRESDEASIGNQRSPSTLTAINALVL